jgi:predicted DsbA family dithiol-disulfide isomerase
MVFQIKPLIFGPQIMRVQIILYSLLLTILVGNNNTRAQDSLANKTIHHKIMEIEIWSDIMCPFCYIGKRKFETALQNFEHKDKVKVIWKSYLLDPGLVSDSTKSIHQHLANTKGWTVEYAREMGAYVSKMAKEEGLQYNMDLVKVANTFDAHRLIQMAKQIHKGDEMEEVLFKAYFTEGKNLADQTVLKSLAISVGLDGEDVDVMFKSKNFAKEVLEDLKSAEDNGVSGVPYFVFDRKFSVSGAQPSETFLNALRKAWKNE